MIDNKTSSLVLFTEKSAFSREVGREIAKDNVNYKKEIEKQLGGDNSRAAFKDLNQVICINLQADEPKQDISMNTVLDAELAAASISSSELMVRKNLMRKKRLRRDFLN